MNDAENCAEIIHKKWTVKAKDIIHEQQHQINMNPKEVSN